MDGFLIFREDDTLPALLTAAVQRRIRMKSLVLMADLLVTYRKPPARFQNIPRKDNLFIVF